MTQDSIICLKNSNNLSDPLWTLNGSKGKPHVHPNMETGGFACPISIPPCARPTPWSLSTWFHGSSPHLQLLAQAHCPDLLTRVGVPPQVLSPAAWQQLGWTWDPVLLEVLGEKGSPFCKC